MFLNRTLKPKNLLLQGRAASTNMFRISLVTADSKVENKKLNVKMSLDNMKCFNSMDCGDERGSNNDGGLANPGGQYISAAAVATSWLFYLVTL